MAGFGSRRNSRRLVSFPYFLFLFFLFTKCLSTNRTNMMTMDTHRDHTLSPAPAAPPPDAIPFYQWRRQGQMDQESRRDVELLVRLCFYY